MKITGKLEQSIHDIQSFFKENDIQFFPIQKKGKIYLLEFKLNIKSYVSETLLADAFHLVLEFDKMRENVLFTTYTKENSAVPFHPHFQVYDKLSLSTLLTKQAKWIDYSNEQGDVVSFVKRVILSLQYNKGYINLDAKMIGNKDAKNWYLEEEYKKSDKFPTDNFLVNPIKVNYKSTIEYKGFSSKPNLNVQQKKFAVETKLPNKKKFKINEETKYNIESKLESDFNFDYDETLNSIINTSSRTKLYVSTKAKKQIFEHIKWGNLQIQTNKNEQGGILLGKVYFDKSDNLQFGIVEQVVYSENTRGNSAYLEMNHEVWSQMLNDADDIIDKSQSDNIQVIGWYHTHPNNLDVFMSGTDMNTQQRFFNQSWHYAIVLNPHKQIWKVFFGGESKECQGYILRENESVNSEQDKITLEEKRPFFTKNNLLILVLIMPLISVIALLLYKDSESDSNEKMISTKENTASKSIDQNTYLYSENGDTINIISDAGFDSIFNRKLFVEMNDASFNKDSTIIQFISSVFIKDSVYSEFGKSRDTLKIPSTEIEIDSSKRWMSFDFKGLIKSKNE